MFSVWPSFSHYNPLTNPLSGHFYLTKLLLPALLDTARSSPEFKPRVLNTSSCTSWLASELNFDSFKDSSARTVMGTHRLYCQSKLGNIIISNEFARRYGDEGLVFVSMNPGNLKSDLLRHVDGFSSKIMEVCIGSLNKRSIKLILWTME